VTVVLEMSPSSWLTAAIVPGLQRQPLKKLAVDEAGLMRTLQRWCNQATGAGHRGFYVSAGPGVIRGRTLSTS
jgi:transposase